MRFFIAPALVTLGLGAWFGSEAFTALIKDLADKRLVNRPVHILTDLGFILAAACAVITACHNLTQIWIR